MPQVVIVSNRLPVSVKKENSKLIYEASIGGLATGLSSYVNNPGNLWIGWPGIASDDLSEQERKSILKELAKYNCYPVFLSKKQIEYFYNGYSNSVLWPLFHSMPVAEARSDRTTKWWNSYQEVNQQFAKAVTGTVQRNSQVWIHDYQLLLLPNILRKEFPAGNIGFFLHIPFPEPKIMLGFKEGKELLDGVLGANLIGFHTTGYLHNFLNFCKKSGEGKIANNRIYLHSRTVNVGEFPMGIDYEKFAKASASQEVKAAIRRVKRKHFGLKLIVSIDRLDPSKGLIERLNAYEELLKRNPQYRKKIVFIMVAAPSRTEVAVYKNLARKLDTLTKKINRIYGSKLWQPVDYIDTAVPFEEVAALFQIADVAFIVPVRDGMNLTAKEFVASNRASGVLILSETAGAASELQDALIVDPEQSAKLVEALEQALAMRKTELKDGLARMKRIVSTNNVHFWARSFVDALQQPISPPSSLPIARTINARILQNLTIDCAQAKRRLLLLDYDGTLMPFVSNYKNAKPPDKILKVLKRLASMPATEVVLVSGRTTDNLDSWFRGLKIDLIAEHGMAIKRAGRKTWQNVGKINNDWKKQLLPILNKYAGLTPGARVEIKPNSLAWHYRAAKPYQAQKYSVIIKKILKPLLDEYDLELLQGNKVLEVKNPKISKGNAIGGWLNRDYPFILAMGDDTTDESMFRALPAHSYSIKVGRGRTSAKLRLASSEQVLRLLGDLSAKLVPVEPADRS